MKPKDYPLPWSIKQDCGYWLLNWKLCMTKEGWRKYQKSKTIDQLIPELDEIFNN